MDIGSIETFLAAASAGSFLEASARLRISPSAVTERIKQLESSLGVRLFERNRRGCMLTDEGRRFLASAQQIAAAWEGGREEVRLPARFSGSVAIGAQHVLWHHGMIDWLTQWRALHENIAIRAVAGSPQRLNHDLASGEIDIAVMYDPVFASEIRYRTLLADELILVAVPDDRPWSERFVRTKWGESADARLAGEIGDRASAGLVLDLGMLAVRWLIEHRASGYVPRWMARTALAVGGLAEVPEAPRVEHSLFMCWRRAVSIEWVDDLFRILSQGIG